MSERFYMGIDADTMGLAYCVVVGARVWQVHYLARRLKARARLWEAGSFEVLSSYDAGVRGLAAWALSNDAVVYLEEAYFKPDLAEGRRGNMKGYGAHREALAEIKVRFRDVQVHVHEVPPADWQGAMFWKGITRDESKVEAAKLAALGLPAVAAACSHQADAYCIARFAQREHGLRSGGVQGVIEGIGGREISPRKHGGHGARREKSK